MLKKIFPGVRSRRLGPRGKGIPHYGGIRDLSATDEQEEDVQSTSSSVSRSESPASAKTRPALSDAEDEDFPSSPPAPRRSNRARKKQRLQPPKEEEDEDEEDDEDEIEEDDEDDEPSYAPPGRSNIPIITPRLQDLNDANQASPQPYLYQPSPVPRAPYSYTDLAPTSTMPHNGRSHTPEPFTSTSSTAYYFPPPVETIPERKDYFHDPDMRIKLEKRDETGQEYDSSPEGHGYYGPFPGFMPQQTYHPPQHYAIEHSSQPFPDAPSVSYMPPTSGRLDHYHYPTPTSCGFYDQNTESVAVRQSYAPAPSTTTTTSMVNIAPSFVQQSFMSLPPYNSSCMQCEQLSISLNVSSFEEEYLLPRYLFRTPPADLPPGTVPTLPPLWRGTPPTSDSTRCMHQDVDEVLGLVVQADDLAWRLHLSEHSRDTCSSMGIPSAETEQIAAVRAELQEMKEMLESKYLAVAQAVRQLGWGAGGQVHLWMVTVLALVQEALGEHETALRTASLAVKVLREWQLRPGFVVGPGSLDIIDPLLQLLMSAPTYQLEVTHLLSMLKTQPEMLSSDKQVHLDYFHRKWNQRFYGMALYDEGTVASTDLAAQS